jgi:probable phosphomutase (TIGR03848 family)
MVRGVAIVVLTRHGRSGANAAGLLAGRRRGINLDDVGRAQADTVGERLARLPLREIVTSPLARCRDTAATMARFQACPLRPRVDKRLVECGYGNWTGKSLSELAKDPLWKVVQHHPSSVVFPEGESMVDMQRRAISAIHDWDSAVEAKHGPDAIWAAVSHADVIKAILADALGMHLDMFQRIVVDPGSVSVIRSTPIRPFVLHQNDQGSDLTYLNSKPKRGGTTPGEASVGGSAGPGSA